MCIEQAVKKSVILQQAIKISAVKKGEATHFALCNGKKIRYLIDLAGGKQRLSKNIAAYSNKLGLLMKLINLMPLKFFEMAGLGYFVNIELHSTIDKHIRKIDADGWNMIIGTYDEKQKLVIQSYKNNKSLATFIKIGNAATHEEMSTELCFLRKKRAYNSFQIPEVLGYEFADVGSPFNIQLTKEFVGEKVAPGVTVDIVRIYKEFSSEKKVFDSVEYEFSHGDFTPWNVKKNKDGYVVFDWEHCGMRVKGFDLLHYVVVPKIKLEGKELSQAVVEGVREVREYIPCFDIDKTLFETEYNSLRLE